LALKDSWLQAVNQPELVGGVLFDTEDPMKAGQVLVDLLTSEPDPSRARQAGLEPQLVETLRKALPDDHQSIEVACREGAAWVLGRRSVESEILWEVVASLPAGAALPLGLHRTTGETMVGLASSAEHRLRFAAPYVDEAGIGYLTDAIVSATRRGVTVDVFDSPEWEPARAAIRALANAIVAGGEYARFRLVRAAVDAPFAHLKVLVVDSSAAYVGSANITAAGLAGRNLELGVLVRGPDVRVIDRILDLYQVPLATSSTDILGD
jgi:phosphatidylserine/phosphatidylglycerophosphate/cardiolipin synthase-like enzyme